MSEKTQLFIIKRKKYDTARFLDHHLNGKQFIPSDKENVSKIGIS